MFDTALAAMSEGKQKTAKRIFTGGPPVECVEKSAGKESLLQDVCSIFRGEGMAVDARTGKVRGSDKVNRLFARIIGRSYGPFDGKWPEIH
jgi:hypothetical protein